MPLTLHVLRYPLHSMKAGIQIKPQPKSCKGAVTIEYALVFPIVIICIIMLIYFGLVYYQQALLQSIVSENLQNCSLLWGYNPEKLNIREGITDREAYLSEGLYWHLFSGSNRKKAVLQENIRREFIGQSIIKPTKDIDIEVNYRNYVLIKKIELKAYTSYKLPFGAFFKSIGLPGDITVTASSETTVQDPKEFIQNMDYLLQIYEETGARDWVMEKCKPLVDSLGKIKDLFR